MRGARDVTVIGAGVVGLSCALFLLRDGHRVTVIDPADPGNGATQRNAGLISSGSCVPVATPGILRRVPKMLLDPLAPLAIRWQYFPRIAPWLLRFLRASVPARVEAISVALQSLLDLIHQSYEQVTAGNDAGRYVHRTGVLYTYETDAALAHAGWSLDLRRRRGVEFEVIHGEELRRREPALHPNVRHGVFYPRTRYVSDLRAFAGALAADIARRGGKFVRARVTGVEPGQSGSRRLRTSAGPRDVDAVVLAAGAWSRPLAARLGARVPLDTERGYVATLPRAARPKIPILSGDRSFAITPMADGLRLAGTVELAGLDAPPNYGRAEALIRNARYVLADVDAGGAVYAMGFRPSMPDSLPVIGPSPAYASVFYAFGHGHIGLACGPATGALVADLVAGRPLPIDLSPFRPDRF